MKFELALWGRDEKDLASGHKRIKAGDIVTIKLYPATWGPVALKKCLIIIADNISSKFDAQKLTVPHFENGVDWYPPDNEIWPAVINKKRFKIPFSILKDGWVTSLDEEKTQDENYAYQPFKTKSFLETGCANQVTIDAGDESEREIALDFSENVSISYDKYLNAFKYSTLKVL